MYYGHFKCNTRRLKDYPALWAYTRDLYQMPGVAGTVSVDEYKAHYFGSHRMLNPLGIVPIGPDLDFSEPHTRACEGRPPPSIARASAQCHPAST